MNSDQNCLSFWFPILSQCGVNVPRTHIHRAPKSDWIARLVRGEAKVGDDARREAELVAAIEASANQLGWSRSRPVFLRTGQTSNKHDWENTCFLRPHSPILKHIAALAEFSMMAGFLGLPFDVWVVREFLPVQPLVYLPNYGNMPLIHEMRYFVKDGEVACSHPYWPKKAIEQGFQGTSGVSRVSEWVERSNEFPSIQQANRVAKIVAEAFNNVGDGEWSVDILAADGEVFVTDMAMAKQSYHTRPCKNAHPNTGEEEEEDDQGPASAGGSLLPSSP